MPAAKQPAASLARPLVRATAGVVIVALLACGIATGLARLGAPAPRMRYRGSRGTAC